MADILITVGVDPSISYKEMQEGISKLVERINKNPPKIKLSLDVDSDELKSVQRKIEHLRNTINANSTVGGTNQNVKMIKAVAKGRKEELQVLQKDTAAKKANTAATNENAAANKNEKATEEEILRARKKALSVLAQNETAERNYSAAKRSSNQASAEAYSNISRNSSLLRNELSNMTDTKGSVESVTKAAERASVSLKENTTTIKSNGDATKSLTSRMTGLASKFSSWLTVSQVMMKVVSTMKYMVTASIELDTAMTELKKVTDETDETYNNFLDKASTRAEKLGASLTDVVTATADFARLGYNITDASDLADAATIYKNVGDGITDIKEASESIIATMQAFGIVPEEAMSIVDKFNEVGNSYAISSDGVGDALLRSAAAMKAANNTLDETIALTAAANTVVQDPEKVGTTLKTVSMFLRAAKTEAEDAGESTEGMASSVSELRDSILALTGNKVDIQIDEDNFKSTYQILKELSQVWGELTDISRANILEMVGGKRNSNVVSALLENFNIAEQAFETSANSAGSAMKENEKYLDSIKGKIDVLKAKFQTLSKDTISGDFVKGIVEAGSATLDLLDNIVKIANKLDTIPAILTTISGVLSFKNKGGGKMTPLLKINMPFLNYNNEFCA